MTDARRTGLVYHERFLDHITRAGHPERVDRLKAVVEGLTSSGHWDRLVHLPVDPDSDAADDETLARLHNRDYIARVGEICAKADEADAAAYVDSPDSSCCRQTDAVARLAVGSVISAVNAVMAGDVDNAFCAVRPPGHHAEADRSMGFCFYANVALATDHLLHHHGLERVAILDFDVHHGNGTQHLFEHGDGRVLFGSIHQSPLSCYPGTGFAEEMGHGDAQGRIINLPMAAGAGDDVMQRALEEHFFPLAEEFDPQFILLSAGFDAHRADPLAQLNATEDFFRWVTRRSVQLADAHADGRLVSVLEGGYDLKALAGSAAAHVEALLGN